MKSAKLIGFTSQIFPIFSMQNWLISWNTNQKWLQDHHLQQRTWLWKNGYIEMLEANQVDGIISEVTTWESKTTIVWLPQSFPLTETTDIPVVSSDDYGGVLAAQTFGQDRCPVYHDYRKWQSNCLLDQNMLVLLLFLQSSYYQCFRVTFLPSKGMEIKNILTHQKPDAIFSFRWLTAILVIKIAQELGISVPDELKVMMGPTFIENYYPQLATIKQPLEEIAHSLLIFSAEDRRRRSQTTGLPVTLLPGKSIADKNSDKFVWVFMIVNFPDSWSSLS